MANTTLLSPTQPEVKNDHKENSKESRSVLEKKELTDAQLCGYIIYWFHHFPNRTYLTTDEIFNQISKFATATREKVEHLLNGLAEGLAISKGGFYNKLKNIPLQDRWKWSLRMSATDGEMPIHQSVVVEKENEMSA